MTNEQNKKLFRKQALDRLSSPEQLDQLIQIVNPKDWLPLSVLGILFLLIIFWSIIGRIPITVSGKGVLIRPRKVVEIQSPISGQLKKLNVKVGDCLKKNNSNKTDELTEIIAFIDPIELKKQLEQLKFKLEVLQKQDIEANNLQIQSNQLETVASQQQQKSLQQRLQNIQALSPVLRNKNIDAIQQRRASLQQSRQDAEALAPVFQKRMETRKQLLAIGAISKDQILEAEQQYRQNLQTISDIQAKLKQLDVDKTETEQKYLENLNNISQFQTQLKEIETQKNTLKEQKVAASSGRKNQILAVKQEIEILKEKIKTNSTIKSLYNGCLLELTISDGQVVNPGTSIGFLEIEAQASEKLVGVAYFPVGDGKQIKPGMEIQLTPTTVKRERFGGIVGTVISVSPFPVTRQGAINVVGNAELVERIITKAQEPQIEVRVEIKPNPTTFTGYKWSSSTGPTNLKLSSGTTTTVSITLEKRRPITFILPFLREWSGIN